MRALPETGSAGVDGRRQEVGGGGQIEGPVLEVVAEVDAEDLHELRRLLGGLGAEAEERPHDRHRDSGPHDDDRRDEEQGGDPGETFHGGLRGSAKAVEESDQLGERAETQGLAAHQVLDAAAQQTGARLRGAGFELQDEGAIGRQPRRSGGARRRARCFAVAVRHVRSIAPTGLSLQAISGGIPVECPGAS